MSRLTQFLGISGTTNDQLAGSSAAAQDDAELAEKGLKHIGTAAEFLNEVAEKLNSNGAQTLGDAIESALPWLESAAEVVGEALPPVKAALKVIGYLTKETDYRALGILAFSLAYQSAAHDAISLIEHDPKNEPSIRLKVNEKKLRAIRAAASDALDAFEGFTLKNCFGQKLMTDADKTLDELAEAAGWPKALRLRLLEGVHARFLTSFQRIVSDGRTKDKFDPLLRAMTIGANETNNFAIIERHIEYQQWRFNQAPVLGKRGESVEGELRSIQCPLRDIYVPLDCGFLHWGQILKMQKADDHKGVRKNPFQESEGGREPMLERVLALIGDGGFHDAIVVQGVAGAGKSAFALSLCIELRRLGLRPIQIRMRNLALDSRMPLLEDLAQAVIQNSGDDEFDALSQTAKPVARDLDLTTLFDEHVTFGSAQICPHILILDGWDEISVSASEGFRQRIEETLRSIRREILGTHKVRVILTGRPSLDVEESRFLQSDTPVLTVRPFVRKQLEKFSETLLTYRLTFGAAVRSNLESRINSLLSRSERTPDEEEGQLGILGLPLLAMLAIWLTLNDDKTPEALGTDRTALYRRLVDMTCRHGGNIEEVATGPRIVGHDLRELLRRTAAAMTMRGTENISYRELERRLKDSGVPARDNTISEVMDKNPIANLMISFFFNAGSREQGCEFIHKSFREYLFAECIVETLKSTSSCERSAQRSPYWKDFEESDSRHAALRRLAPLLAPQWLMPDVATHLSLLLNWEITRAATRPDEFQMSGDGTHRLEIVEWERIRDFMAEAWDWWADGVHLRPQPFIRKELGTLDYVEPFAVLLVKTIAPTDRPESRWPEPVRVNTLDAHLGDALFRLNCTIHFEINRATGWLPKEFGTIESDLHPEYLWSDVKRNEQRRYQSLITRSEEQWLAFAPSSPDEKNHYLELYCSRINGAGWRPQGSFPGGISMNGIDLADSRLCIRVADALTWSFSLRYANLESANLNYSDIGDMSDFSYSFAQFLRCSFCLGANTNFRGADLENAYFVNSAFFGIEVGGANLKGADFTAAELSGTDKKQLKGAISTRVWIHKDDSDEPIRDSKPHPKS